MPVLLRTGCGKSPKRESQQVTVTVWKTARFQRGDCLWPCKGGMEFWVGTFFFNYALILSGEKLRKYKKKSTRRKLKWPVIPPIKRRYVRPFICTFFWHILDDTSHTTSCTVFPIGWCITITRPCSGNVFLYTLWMTEDSPTCLLNQALYWKS